MKQDFNPDEIVQKENSGTLGTLPREILNEVASLLPFKDLQNLRHTCHFFKNHALLKETLNKKAIKVITMEERTFWQFNGKVFASGSNYFGALGLGKGFGSCFNPKEVILPSNKPIAKIAAGYDFIFYFDTDGHCYFCGYNSCGQLGNSDIIQYSLKTMQLPNDRLIGDVAVGHNNCFLRDDQGTWYGMGNNDCGRLGIDSRQRYTDIPIKISLPNNLPIAKVIPGQYDTFFQDIENNWFHCGSGSLIGKSESTSAPQPFTLPDGKPVDEIITRFKACFIRERGGQWYTCGENPYNELGVKEGAGNKM